ncbi:MAG TPA: outer membrane protein assembly factor BamD [Gammaproteobacteria bacterium]|nr:outer membrane protein assembly factor BamD [Gammaproteobacteria bacterium]
MSLNVFFPVRASRLFIFALLTLLLAACAANPDKEDDMSKWSAEKLFKEAKMALEAGDYEVAIETYETLEAKYPFGRYAEQAQLDTAYAYFKFDEPDTAITSADRFIKLHPRHRNVDYAYYLRGLASESKKQDPLDFIEKQDPSLRDPSSTLKSYEYYVELVKKFPNSRYTADALRRMGYLRNDLAMHEIHVARYYAERGAYVAVANRAKYVVSNFPRTPASRLALQLLVEAYTQLKLDDLAADAQRVLDLNPAVTDQQSTANKKPAKAS